MAADERLSFDAVSAHTLIAVEHRHRYLLAREVCAGKRVLDLCCGVGYGSALLAQTAAAVVGVDRDHSAVAAAREHVDAATCTFEQDDAHARLRRLEPGDVDVVVCFEGLEHVEPLEPVVAELRRLADGGVGLLLSVPNSATFEEENEWHVTDFDLALARRTFGDFPDAELLFQSHAEGSLVRHRAEGPVQAQVALSGEQDLDWANHFLIAVGAEVRAGIREATAQLHLAVAPVSHRYMRGIERANRALFLQNASLMRDRLGVGPVPAASPAAGEAYGPDAQAEIDRAWAAQAGALAAHADAIKAYEKLVAEYDKVVAAHAEVVAAYDELAQQAHEAHETGTRWYEAYEEARVRAEAAEAECERLREET